MLFDRDSAVNAPCEPKIIKHKRRKSRERTKKTGLFLAAYLSLFLSALAISVVMCAQNRELYLEIQENCGLFEGENPENRSAVILMNEEITEFLSGRTEKIQGASVRANRHMMEVRRLLWACRAFGVFLFILSAALMYIGRTGKTTNAGCISLVPVFAFAALFAVFAFCDFGKLFYSFHILAFDNDLWILDPGEDYLIRCLPEAFFLAMSRIALFRALIAYALLTGATLVFINKFGRRDAK